MTHSIRCEICEHPFIYERKNNPRKFCDDCQREAARRREKAARKKRKTKQANLKKKHNLLHYRYCV